MQKSSIKRRAVKEKGGKCSLCGYRRCLSALHFHHLNSFEKEINISQCSTWEEAKKELEKCVLLCSNCHLETHRGYVDLETLVEFNR